jgi:hypothetical protein
MIVGRPVIGTKNVAYSANRDVLPCASRVCDISHIPLASFPAG